MPIASIKAVHSVSSEDPAWPADNLLSRHAKKWRCKAGEKLATVCLELDRAAQITGLDIGNEHSASVAVQVARHRGARDADFVDILLSSTFMSPLESRNGTNGNRVRCFHREALVASAASADWSLLKLVCAQPYSHQRPFGLAFVKVHVTAAPADQTSGHPAVLVPECATPQPKTASANVSAVASFSAKFKMRRDSTDSDGETSGSLFQRWKQMKAAGGTIASPVNVPKPETEAISTASKKASTSLLNTSVHRNRRELLYVSEDDEPNERLDRKLELDRQRQNTPANRASPANRSRTAERTSSKFQLFIDDNVPKATPKRAHSPNIADATAKRPSPADEPASPPKKPRTEERPQRTPSAIDRQSAPKTAERPTLAEPVGSSHRRIAYKPRGQLLEGVVLVISGIQNPERAQLRDKALALGAKYKPDWTPDCTHLICAFRNTPKYNQVRGHGKIIKKDWILSCHEQNKRIPWRRFALDTGEKDQPDSEDEIVDLARRPPTASGPDAHPNAVERLSPEIGDRLRMDSGSDTDDELERFRARAANKPAAGEQQPADESSAGAASTTPDDHIYDATTDEDRRPAASVRRPEAANERSCSPLPEFFRTKRFYLSSNLSANEADTLRRFVNAYGGQLIRNAAEAHYIVSNRPKQLAPGFAGDVVKPLWVYECNDSECLLPIEPFKFH